MSEASIEAKWIADRSCVVLSSQMVRFAHPKKTVRFAHPIVTSLHYTPKRRPEEFNRCFFTETELAVLEGDRQRRIFEEQFEISIQSGTGVTITFPVRRVKTYS
jgi:hypothetical protein